MRLLLKKGESKHQTLDVNGAVREVLKLVRGDLLHHKITLQVDLAPQLPAVSGDSVQIQQVLLNLLMNGCEAMTETDPGVRRMYIRSLYRGGAVQISVSDRGRGILAAEKEKIFEPFFTTKMQGMGMGLAICRSIITAHGGQLWAEGNSDCGASFHFTLPVDSCTYS